MKYFSLLFFIFLASVIVSAQSGMVKGYIITEKGDTMRGEAKVNPKKEIDNYSKVNFKDESGVQKMYRPTKIKGYGFNTENYISMDSPEDRKFYKVLAAGEINFYKLGYKAMRMNALVFEVEYYMSRRGDTELVLIKESKFKKQMAEWMKDKPEFMEAYGDEKKFNLEKALAAINNYNSWKAGH